ncbi:MAG: hypothetical protein WDO14_12310 [Bacteroidota bacterium]
MRYYRIFNLLSLDVALGAVICAAFFAKILRVHVLLQGYLLLGIIVWLIYTADHLLDAWTMREAATSERHSFHQKHFITILLAFLGAGIVAAGLIFLIRIQLISAGIVLSVFVVTYLLVNRGLKYFKELTGSLLYTGGVLLPAWSLHTQPATAGQLTLIIIFTLIAFTNLLIFARFSIGEDMLNRQKSLATIMGVKPMNTLISIVFAISFSVMIYQAIQDVSSDLIILFVMELILLVIFVTKYFRYDDRYRLYGDAIFLLPVILLT